MYYTIYQVTNLLNGKIYIGKHQTTDPYDSYYGSGKAIKAALKRHGRENFTKEVLFVFDTEEEMNAKERELITEEFVARSDTYNMGVGGEGGAHFKGKTHSEATRKRLSEAGKGRTLSEEQRKMISEANSRRVLSDETKRKIAKSRCGKRRIDGSDHWEATKEKISQGMKRYWAQVSDEEKAGRSNYRKPYERTPEIRAKISAVMKAKHAKRWQDTIWIKHPETKESFRIQKNKFDEYEQKGYVRGRLLRVGGVSRNAS